MRGNAVILALFACGVAIATEPRTWHFSYAPFHGSYSIYGGGLGDPVAPSSRSKNVAFRVTGKVAKQMFEAMPPDLKNACGADDGQRMRQRAQLVCFQSSQEGYSCDFGFDLISGRSIAGSIC